jgi:thiosulfate/3-mercaptopyruvate sulfurtransferase
VIDVKSFVSASWLNDHLSDQDLVVIDCRLDLFDREKGKHDYLKNHIPGSFFLDINTDFAGSKKTHGGARPLPRLEEFINKIENLGISNDSKIVVYDEITFSSARAFWMFKYLGHQEVYILNGGYSNWIKEGYEVTSNQSKPLKKGEFKANVNQEIYCEIDYIQDNLFNQKVTKVDARAYNRFSGDYEPHYSKKGHIPNSINYHSKDLLTEDGFLKEKIELNNRLDFLRDKEEVVLYCGSGINAALNFAVMHDLNIDSKLYVGSVSDWISYEENDLEMSE